MTTSTDPVTVDRPRTRREIYTVMSGLMIAMLLAMLDNLIVGTALPTIVGDLGGLAHLSWVVTAYALATAVSTPVWAKLGDLFGRKGVFMASIVVFLVGSALSGLAQDMGQLIAFRGLQGVGAGGLMVGAIAIIGDLVPPRERGRYQGLDGRGHAAGLHRRTAAGRVPHRQPELALGVLHQPAARGARTGGRRAHHAPAGQAAGPGHDRLVGSGPARHGNLRADAARQLGRQPVRLGLVADHGPARAHRARAGGVRPRRAPRRGADPVARAVPRTATSPRRSR